MLMLDFSKGYLRVRQPITVGVARKTSRTAHAAAVPVNYAYREPIEQGTLQDGAALADRKAVFELWRTPLVEAGYTWAPRPGDAIEHAGVRFTVDEVEHLGRGNRYRCHCTRE